MAEEGSTIYDVVIIGGGPGGYTCALYCARAGLDTLVLEMLSPGGQMTLTEVIDNYPGLPDGVDGFTLGDAMQRQAEKFGAKSEMTEVLGITDAGAYKTVHTSDMGDLQARTVVVATGANARKLGLPNEDELADRGIHYCAACDGMRFKGRTVALVGGGNTALEDALLLARVCQTVYLVHRRDAYRADKIYADAVAQAANIVPVLNCVPEKADCTDRFEGLHVRNVLTGEQRFLPCDGLFVSVGRVPNTAFLGTLAEKDPSGYLIADETTRTSVPGLFAVGDVRTKPMRQVVTAAADGAVASVYIQQYIAQAKKP